MLGRTWTLSKEMQWLMHQSAALSGGAIYLEFIHEVTIDTAMELHK